MPPLKLQTTPFFQNVNDAARDYLHASLSHTFAHVREKGEPPRKGSSPAPETYASSVWKRAFSMIGRFHHLREAQQFLSWLPSEAQLNKLDLAADGWYEYHYGYCIVLLSGLPDIALLLTNEVYRLGLAPHVCNQKTVLQNAWVKDTPVAAAVKDLGEAVKKHQEARNLYLHRGVRPDPAEDPRAPEFRWLNYGMLAARVSGARKLQSQTHRFFRSQGKSLSQAILIDIEDLTERAAFLFGCLHPVFIAKLDEESRAR